MKRLAWLLACLAGLLTACDDPVLPLEAPLPAATVVPQALKVVLLDKDLPQLAETVRAAAGKKIDVAAPAALLPAGQQVAAWATALVPAQGEAKWTPSQHLALRWPIGPVSVALAVAATETAACGVTWTATGGEIGLEIEVARDLAGQVAPLLAAGAQISFQDGQIADPQGCLPALGPGLPAALGQQVAATLGNALTVRFHGAALQAVRTVFPATLELAGRIPHTTRWGDALEARMALTWLPLGPATAQIAGSIGTLAHADLALGLDVDAAACAVDAPPPTLDPQALGQPPLPPPGKSFLRRALVLDRAALARLAWLLTRAGQLCRQSEGSLEGLVDAGWATSVLPALGAWVEGAPVAARFWPGASPTVTIVDSPEGPGMEWTLPDATLEVIGRVADTELVVLQVRGGFRVTLRLAVAEGADVGLRIVAGRTDSAVVSSPVLGGALPMPSTPALAKLVDAALHGIFDDTPVLPLGAVLPEGTVVTAVSRAGDALWLWLEGGPPG